VHLVGNPSAAPLAVAAGLAEAWTPFDAPAVTGLFRADGPSPASALGPLAAAVAWCADPAGVVAANLARLGASETVVASSRPPAGERRHVARHLLGTLASLGVDPGLAYPDVRLELPTPAVEAAGAQLGRVGLADASFIAIHPGSGSPGKNWPAESLATLIGRLPDTFGLAPLLLAGPAETDTLERLLARLPAPPPVLRDLPLPMLAAVMRRASAYLGNDSGPTHLAAMLGRPTLALFGPTDPAVWAPLGPRVRALRHQPLAALAPARVLEALQELLRPG
jgi:heptosyltransferase III